MSQDFHKTASFLRANVIGSLFFIAVFLGGSWLYAVIWGMTLLDVMDAYYALPTFRSIVIVILGVIAHELLHGVGFRYFAGASWRDIRFGIHLKFLVPYASCQLPMTVEAYRGVTALPGIVTGILPLVAGLVTGSVGWTAFGAILLGGAGGDALILWYIRQLPAGTMVRDSQTLIGCEVIPQGELV